MHFLHERPGQRALEIQMLDSALHVGSGSLRLKGRAHRGILYCKFSAPKVMCLDDTILWGSSLRLTFGIFKKESNVDLTLI
jgi:hypothetical protein